MKTSKPRTLILRTAGTNCDGETAHAFELAGAATQSLHINRLLENPRLLGEYQILAVPGGFSYGDDIAAGRILANQIAHHLRDALGAFVEAGKPVIGICNGFQVLVKTDLLPGPLAGRGGQTCTLTNNDSGQFIDRWVRVAPRSSKCIWTHGLDADEPIELPIAHGEGKFVPADESVRRALWDNEQVALVYVPLPSPGSRADSSGLIGLADMVYNPNGSVDDIAGVCDASGLVLGLMPHPERHVDPTQHPAWTRQRTQPVESAGIGFFRNAVRHVTGGVGAGV